MQKILYINKFSFRNDDTIIENIKTFLKNRTIDDRMIFLGFRSNFLAHENKEVSADLTNKVTKNWKRRKIKILKLCRTSWSKYSEILLRRSNFGDINPFFSIERPITII